MTISNQIAEVTLLGNGLTTVFPYGFIIPTSANAVVTLTDSTTGANTVLTTSQYAISGIGNPDGGTVVYPITGAPLPLGKKLSIQRIVPLTQETDITNQGGFYPEVLESALDYVVMQIQQLAAAQRRTVMVPVGSNNTDLQSLVDQLTDALDTIAGLIGPLQTSFNTLRAVQVAALPTTQPTTHGIEWNNGGVICVS